MKDETAHYAGKCHWWRNRKDIWHLDKKGKFFRGIYTYYYQLKIYRYDNLSFRLCKEKI